MKFQTFVQNLSAFALRGLPEVVYLYPPTPLLRVALLGCIYIFKEKDMEHHGAEGAYFIGASTNFVWVLNK